jgi:hypothetical protein
MTLSALGIFSAAGAGGGAVASDYQLIETYILGSNQASVIFSNLGTYASTYKHLQIRMAVKSSNAAVWEVGLMRLNGDTGTNYSVHSLEATYQPSLIIRNTGFANTDSMSFSAAGSTNTGVNAAAVIDLVDCFSTTKNKTVRLLSGYHQPSAGELSFRSGAWRNTASITSATIFPLSGTQWLTGSRFSIYGIRG